MIIYEDDELRHYGILRKSGRYPWGSGDNVTERSRTFLDWRQHMLDQGLSEATIAKGIGMTTTDLRATLTIAKNAKKQADISRAQQLKEKAMSNVAIGKAMGINESVVRSLLAPGEADKADILTNITDNIRRNVDERGFIDVGKGVENQLGISKEKLAVAVAVLRAEGYELHNIQVDQLGTANKTLVKVLAPAGTTYKDIVQNKDKNKNLDTFSEDHGRTTLGIDPPLSVDLKRVGVRYAEDGGTDADGVIYVRPGVSDLSLGGNHYAQVRIAVNGTHFLKGMALYRDDLPDGVDLMFNANKSNTGNKLDAMKPMKDDPENPFGSVVRQIKDNVDSKGNRKVSSAMNIVNDEENWDDWSRNLASQMLSKQKPSLAKQQLELTYAGRKDELETILSLTNPAVRQKLLESYADDVDAAAVHLKAAALPRQKTHVILPINSLKETEIYAPNYQNGERVALIRYPHGGTFEIPELTVNNRHPQAKKAIGNARAAVGINSKVAQRLSGADFDGDTVVVIPNNNKQITSTPALKGLKDFDPQSAYPGYEGMRRMTEAQKQAEMGKISNLITDMTIKGASGSELARAVRHSMVVIDAEKHGLNYKLSAERNGIAQLKEKYQGGANKGASTLISRTTSDLYVNQRTLRKAKDGGPIDKKTGEKVYVETGEGYIQTKVNKRTGVVTEKFIPRQTKTTKGAEAKNAHDLSSGTEVESYYADHANRMKALGNQARLASVHTKSIPYSPSAKKAYANEVASLDAKLHLAVKNKPLERQAQIVANATVAAKKAANPDMAPAELKKIKGLALTEARVRVGAQKNRIIVTDEEWKAIQSGAISHNKLVQILDNADLEVIKKLATPKEAKLMTNTKTQRAKSMLAAGWAQAEVASALGVSLTTLKDSLK